MVTANGNGISQKLEYNGQEFEEAEGYAMNEMDWRHYDPAIARWVAIDPVIHFSTSPYSAFENNPVYWSDPSGKNVKFEPNQITFDGDDAKNFFKWYLDMINGGEGDFIVEIIGDVEGQFSAVFEATGGGSGESDGGGQGGQFNVIKYEVYNNTINNILKGGLKIRLGYNDFSGNLMDLNFIQTIDTNMPLGGITSPYLDTRPNDDDLNYYYTCNEQQLMSNREGFTIVFSDTPTRTMKDGIWWKAELSLVMTNSNGRIQPIQTISYGFQMQNGSVQLLPIQYVTPSNFHLNQFHL